MVLGGLAAMSEAYRVEVRSVDGGPTGLGWGGSATVVVDRGLEAGGRGLGFNGGQLLNLAVAGCVSNDLFREAGIRGIHLSRVRVSAESDYAGTPPVSTPIVYRVEVSGDADDAALDALVAYVDSIAEIPNSIRGGTEVRLLR
jgi:putative redox protein